MAFGEAKIYYDGSHYIAIPHTEGLKRKKFKHKEREILLDDNMKPIPLEHEEISTIKIGNYVLEEVELDDEDNFVPVKVKVKNKGTRTNRKEIFEKLYNENRGLRKAELKQAIINGMVNFFSTDLALKSYVETNLDRKERNIICRRTRMVRKVNLQEFNYFCTFTYDDKKHIDSDFRKKLSVCLNHYANRKAWKYVGVWERSPEKQRLHFHGLFFIPEGTMPGKLIEVKDYNFKTHSMKTTIQNTFFNDRFGRSDFEVVATQTRKREAIAYILKYIEKSGEKIVYSRGLPQYFISDVIDEDIACRTGNGDRKAVLFDDFKCFDEGEYMGNVSQETIKKMRKANS